MKDHYIMTQQAAKALAGTPAEAIAKIVADLVGRERAGALILSPLELGLIARQLNEEVSADGHRHWLTIPTDAGAVVLECNLFVK
jgi:hypothetical protein